MKIKSTLFFPKYNLCFKASRWPAKQTIPLHLLSHPPSQAQIEKCGKRGEQ